ncbi:MAG TPA: hypothetical protein VHG51_15855, partial [Longimicrobiaceae bacterium]|nr:hypothetical protein [Longimicrobiaceae bacterium]
PRAGSMPEGPRHGSRGPPIEPDGKMNRILAYLAEPEERRPTGDYWVVAGLFGTFYVAADVARGVERALDRAWGRWVVFRDLSGSRIRVRRKLVYGVYESTAEQRRADREFYRALSEESEADPRPWE